MRHAIVASWPPTEPIFAVRFDLEHKRSFLGTFGLEHYQVVAGFRIRSALRHLRVPPDGGMRLVELGCKGVPLEQALRDTCGINLGLAADHHMKHHEWCGNQQAVVDGLHARAAALALLYVCGRESGVVRSGELVVPVAWGEHEALA